ncbi:MAG: phosphoribosylformylglycinamidine synthase I [Chloroflexi bacterium]|nr:phosphoribosylformylglycinamidine synthase I [Chloroflexota bacterium]|tara:strand:- start:1142 stop:1834 length:693 start_codon:yes stop_codon:yes gene_type:complete
MKFGIIIFPGTWSDRDTFKALSNVMDYDSNFVWHNERNIDDYDCIVIPGGFSYGDYLRCGAIAKFSPIMDSVKQHAKKGKPVIGICNGFQILCESGLLPGALVANQSMQFKCEWVNLKIENRKSIFTNKIKLTQNILKIPISHGEGNYIVEKDTLKSIKDNNQIIFKYSDKYGKVTDASNPNGSIDNIAGITNKKGNIMGMMPHPEKAAELILGSKDGRLIFQSLVGNYL